MLEGKEMSKYTINELANSKGVSQPVREALLQMEAELDATNRQVEILTDALAESRREIDAMIALARADEREQIEDEWSMCVQSDLEHGVKSLNEQAAKDWFKNYPEIAKFGAWLEARSCPPCNEDCEQGRNCPARKNK
jgi:hypothetical protein